MQKLHKQPFLAVKYVRKYVQNGFLQINFAIILKASFFVNVTIQLYFTLSFCTGRNSNYLQVPPGSISSKKTTKNSTASNSKGPREPTEDQAKKVSKLKNIDSQHANLILNEVIEK